MPPDAVAGAVKLLSISHATLCCAGVLNLLNETHATWELFRNQDGGKVAADSITITKGPAQCRDVA